jgi:hypothetical protein
MESYNMSDTFLNQVLAGVKRTPGLLAGAPVDVTNLVAGLAAGKGTEGLVDKPILGSRQLNSLFGLDQKSGGLAQDSVEAVTGLLTPGGAAKVAIGGMIVPARLAGDKSLKAMLEFVRAESLPGKTSKQLYDQTGVFRGTLDPKKLKAIIDDSGATFNTTHPAWDARYGLFGLKSVPGGKPTTVKEILNHPKLQEIFDKDPELGKIADYVVSKEPPGSGAYGSFNPNSNVITLADRKSEKDLMSTLLHEIQHAIQYKTGMIGGGNPGMFVEYSGRVQRAQKEARKMLNDAWIEVGTAQQNSVGEAAAIAKHKQIKQDLDAIEGVNQKAYRHYLELQGETEARVTQQMFTDPRKIKSFDPSFPDRDATIYAGDLKNPKDPIVKYDMEPSIKALIDSYQPATKP